MMDGATAPPIFDMALAEARLARATAMHKADFLLRHAASEMADRLAGILRDFTAIADIGTPDAAFGQAARRDRPQASLAAAPFAALASPAGLGLQEAAFDLALSGLVLHQVNDLPGVFAQTRRLLKPDGLFMACLPAGRTLQELRECLAEAEMHVLGGMSPRVAPFADIRDLGALLQRARFALPVTDSELLTLRYDDLFGLMADLRAMGAANALTERLHRPTPRRLFLHAAELYAERYADPDGRIRATVELVWLVGWAPHESQQKPLRPGSAKMRLADALGVPERPLKRE
jgi:SAM-dependent methyltransferase